MGRVAEASSKKVIINSPNNCSKLEELSTMGDSSEDPVERLDLISYILLFKGQQAIFYPSEASLRGQNSMRLLNSCPHGKKTTGQLS